MNIKTGISFAARLMVLCGLSLSASAVYAQSITLISWGGAYTQAHVESQQKPWTEKTGITFKNIDEGGKAPAGIRSQVNAGNVTWDIVSVTEGNANNLCDEGIVAEISYDTVLAKGSDGSKPSEDFISGLDGCLVPNDYYATVFGYNKKAVKEGQSPKTIEDVFNLRKFPGKRALEKTAVNNLAWALMADGVPAKDIFEILKTKDGQDRAFRKLDTIKSDVIWWTAGAQPPQLLADGEVFMASAYNGRLFNAQVVEDQDIGIIWDGQALELEGWVVPRGRLSKEVLDYLKFSTDSKRLAAHAENISYGPARKSSAGLVGRHVQTGVDMKPHLPTSPQNFNNPLIVDASFVSAYGDTLNERFNAWLAK